MKLKARPTALAMSVAAAIFPVAAHADKAIVVGVNHYQSISPNLTGCVNDANTAADALRKYGFEVTLLTDDQASHDGILAALAEARNTVRPNERFAFYFAGHGTEAPDKSSVLLPTDATTSNETNDITADSLVQAVKAIRASSRTVLLDSCFSGGMMRSIPGLKHLHPHFHSRYYRRATRRPGTKNLVVVNRQDQNNHLNGNGKVCYFTAARNNEQAGEDEFDGASHGVFTYFLSQTLNGEKDRWGNVGTKVASKVADYMDDTQHPMLSPAYVDKTVFDDQTDPNPHPDPVPDNNVWDEYNADHADPSRVALTMSPNKTTVQVEEDLSLRVKVGSSGYLVLLERGVDNSLNLWYPSTRSASDARVDAGSTVDLPGDGKAFGCDAPGTERVKAILFSTREKAQALLDALPASGSVSSWRRARNLHVRPSQQAPFYTSDITFEAVPKGE